MNRIILQDNDQEVVEVLTIALEQAGFVVYSTIRNENLLQHIDEFRPHVVMLDFRLSGQECLKAYRLIRDKYPHLPVIALSCNSNFHKEYSKFGFDGYILKPFDLDNLYSILRKHIPQEVPNK